MPCREFDLKFNGKTGREHGINVEKRPDMPGAVGEMDFLEIPGRDELVATEEGVYRNITISIQCSFKVPPEEWGKKVREVRGWLRGAGDLIFSDAQDGLWKVKKVEIDTFERPLRSHGRFTANFICPPFEYVAEGQELKTIEEVKENPYRTSHPIYYIKQTGACSLTVNGKEVTISYIGGNIVVDTERMITYSGNELQNRKVSGNYEDLYLMEGKNEISITGGEVSIIPNWRWR